MCEFPKAYACYNKDINIRMDSTSGGIFTLIAEYVLCELDGVVFGASFDEQFNVRHICVDDHNGLNKLRGSKYIQSTVADIYNDIELLLKKGKYVLFTGTPCQISGLKTYLNIGYENLICMDFVCHGVASKGVWSDYVSWLKKKGEIKNIVFKSKVKGWKKWYFRVEYMEDGKVYTHRGGMNAFMRSYLLYCNIRPSCYHCQFKGLNHNSDFTISDCWGVGEANSELNDDKGLSALLIHTVKGERIFEKIRGKIIYQEYPASELMGGNWTAFFSVSPNLNRKAFFLSYKKYGGVYAINRFFKPSIKNWIGYYRMRLLGKEK